MERSDGMAFGQALAVLAEAFGEPMSKARSAAYFDALADLPLDDVRAAIRSALRDCTFFPKPVELRKYSGTHVDAGAAYAALQKAKRASGAYFGPPPLPDGMKLLVERLGGWRNVMASPEDALWRRFTHIYEGVRLACVARSLPLLEMPKQLDGPAPLRLVSEGR